MSQNNSIVPLIVKGLKILMGTWILQAVTHKKQIKKNQNHILPHIIDK